MILQSNVDTLITVYGGSGFLGRNVVRALAREGYRIRVAVRRPELAGHLQPLGRVGQIVAVQCNVRFPDSVAAAAHNAHVLINLVGILAERRRQRFDQVHAAGAGAVARAAADGGKRLIHVSAIGADPDSPALYGRSKAAGEAAVRDALPGAIVVRPSILFGPEDDFFNRFAALARLAPALPLIGGGVTRLQPAFVGDVAQAIAVMASGAGQPGTIYEFGGPDVLTLRQVLEFVLTTIERRRLLVPIPFRVARLLAAFLQWLPQPPLTPDQVRMLERDNVVSEAAVREGRTLAAFGIEPVAIAAVVEDYLWRFRKRGEFRSKLA